MAFGYHAGQSGLHQTIPLKRKETVFSLLFFHFLLTGKQIPWQVTLDQQMGLHPRDGSKTVERTLFQFSLSSHCHLEETSISILLKILLFWIFIQQINLYPNTMSLTVMKSNSHNLAKIFFEILLCTSPCANCSKCLHPI